VNDYGKRRRRVPGRTGERVVKRPLLRGRLTIPDPVLGRRLFTDGVTRPVSLDAAGKPYVVGPDGGNHTPATRRRRSFTTWTGGVQNVLMTRDPLAICRASM